MPQFQLSPGVVMHYYDDDFTDPWVTPEAALLLHGNAESGLAWNGWMPLLGRRLRIVRPDIRGFGRSTPMPEDYAYSLNGLIDDFLRLMDHLGIERFHLVAAKVTASAALLFAASQPRRVQTLTVISAADSVKKVNVSGRGAGGKGFTETSAEIDRLGIEAWARQTMALRMGSDCSPEMIEGWVQFMARTAPSTQKSFRRGTWWQDLDATAVLPQIACPTLVITTDGSKVGSPVAEMRSWQERIPHSKLLVLPGDSFHVAATQPEACAHATLDFIERAGVVKA